MVVSLRLPLVLVDDSDLVRVSRENPGYQFEREEDGTLTISPNFTLGGARSGKATFQLYKYSESAGGLAIGSNVGFAIGPKRAIKSPDASWVRQARIDSLNDVERQLFWPLSPDVAIEVRISGDDFRHTIAKIDFYIKHGSEYAVAIDPEKRRVVERGVPPAGLVLDFAAIMK
jgi:Uma2 family endonuclease